MFLNHKWFSALENSLQANKRCLSILSHPLKLASCHSRNVGEQAAVLGLPQIPGSVSVRSDSALVCIIPPRDFKVLEVFLTVPTRIRGSIVFMHSTQGSLYAALTVSAEPFPHKTFSYFPNRNLVQVWLWRLAGCHAPGTFLRKQGLRSGLKVSNGNRVSHWSIVSDRRLKLMESVLISPQGIARKFPSPCSVRKCVHYGTAIC